MVTTLLLSAVLVPTAPIPKDVAPAGPAPRVVELKPGTDGKITLTVTRQEKVTVNVTVAGPNGAPPQVQPQERTVNRVATVELSDVKGLKAYSAVGKELDLKETLAKLKDGGVVVMSSDGNKVDPTFTRVFKDDTVVLVSPEFANMPNAGGATTRPGIGRPLPGGIRPLPVNPGGIQIQPLPIQVGPGKVQIQVLPAVEVLPPVEKKEEKK